MVETYRFAIKSIAYTCTATGIKVVVTSDVPCHLYMRWTHVLPLIHLDPFIRRGIAIGTRPRYCFDVYHDNEQEETGDTLTHSFVKEPWLACEPRWFYFFGCRYGYPMPSESPIFRHYNDCVITSVFDALRTSANIMANEATYDLVRTSPTGVVQDDITTGTTGQSKEGVNNFFMWRGAWFFDTSSIPGASSIISAYIDIHVICGGVHSAITDDNQQLRIVPGYYLDPALVVPSDYGKIGSWTTNCGTATKFPWWAACGLMYHIDLTPAGLFRIYKDGITCFASRGTHDINNIPDGPGFIERNRYDYRIPDSWQLINCWLVVTYKPFCMDPWHTWRPP